MQLSDLSTPCAVVDLDVVEANTARMSERARALGVRLRPHVKTHKTLEAAALSVAREFGGLTVSTLREARFFAEGGARDVTYAVPLPPSKVDEALDLARDVEQLHLLVDDAASASALERGARSRGVRASVFLKVDCGYHRAGVDPRSDQGRSLARALADSAHLAFAGVLTHAGHAYAARDRQELVAIAEEERRVTVDFAESLRAEGVEVPVVSVGSTPTLSVAESLAGVDEARPGNYVFYDLSQVALGACRPEDVALTVLSTVIGVYPRRSSVLVDAGALALGKDAGPTHLDAEFGMGRLVAPAAVAGHRLTGLSQEHGQLEGVGNFGLGVGERVRIAPNHSCLTSALHEAYWVVRGEEVVARWEPVRGWSSRSPA